MSAEDFTDELDAHIAESIVNDPEYRATLTPQEFSGWLAERERAAAARALRDAADDMEQFEPFPGEESDWLRERAHRLHTPAERDCHGYALGSSCECQTSADCALNTPAQPCACGSPGTYSLNPAEVVTHTADACWITPAERDTEGGK